MVVDGDLAILLLPELPASLDDSNPVLAQLLDLWLLTRQLEHHSKQNVLSIPVDGDEK